VGTAIRSAAGAGTYSKFKEPALNCVPTLQNSENDKKVKLKKEDNAKVDNGTF